MASAGYETDESLSLLPLKKVKVVDRTKCVICQTDKTDETLRKPWTIDLESFSTASKIRKDKVYERIFLDANAFSTQCRLWHSSWYNSYTSTRNLSFASREEKRCIDSYPEVTEFASANLGKITSSLKTGAVDWSLYPFCQKLEHKGTKVLVNVSSFATCDLIRVTVNVRGNSAMIRNKQDIDLIAAELI